MDAWEGCYWSCQVLDSRSALHDSCRVDGPSGETGCTLWQVGRCGVEEAVVFVLLPEQGASPVFISTRSSGPYLSKSLSTSRGCASYSKFPEHTHTSEGVGGESDARLGPS